MEIRKWMQKRGRWMVGALTAGILCFSAIATAQAAAPQSETYGVVSNETYESGETKNYLVGSYQLNYTGNTNYYEYLGEHNMTYGICHASDGSKTNNIKNSASSTVKNAAKGKLNKEVTNSTTKKLVKGQGATGIVKAYLVWESRAKNAPSAAVALVDKAGNAKKVTAFAAYQDSRMTYYDNGDKKAAGPKVYCMYADVTAFVKAGGYGNYSVCNIPIHGTTKSDLTADNCGGESISAWQLIVVEENPDLPVRAVQLSVGSQFARTDNYQPKSREMTLDLNPLLTKVNDGTAITGQVLYIGSASSDGRTDPTVKVQFKDGNGSDNGNPKKILTGKWINTYSDGICADLEEFRFQEAYNSQSMKITTSTDQSWCTFLISGIVVDIADQKLTGGQQTIVSSAEQATVTEKFTNASTQGNTGFSNGKFTVTLDSALTPSESTPKLYRYKWNSKTKAYVKKTYTGKVSGHTVTYTDIESSTADNADTAHPDYFEYSIPCIVTQNSGKTEFSNSSSMTGYLVSRGTTIRKTLTMYEKDSKADAMYRLSVVSGDFISSVTATGGSAAATVTRDYLYDADVSVTATPENGSEFTRWTQQNAKDGSTSAITKNPYAFTMPAQNVTLTAEGKLIERTVTLHAGTGIASVSGGGKYKVGTKVSITATLEEGYHFRDWTGTYQTGQIDYSFTMPAQDVDMTANAEVNQYTIHFHPNDGAELSHVEDIVAEYGREITLPNIITSDGTAAYVKYTLDGENVTEGVLSGAIPESMLYGYTEPEQEEEASETGQPGDETEDSETEPSEGEAEASEEEQTEETEQEPVEIETEALEPEDETEASGTEPESKEKAAGTETTDEETDAEPQPTVYPSVFLGWALEDNKDKPTAQWKADETVKNLVKEHGGEITLYAVWDDCPWIVGEDLYYTLEEAQNGVITEAEILSHATASDREDGSPIDPGFHENGTSFSIPDYRAENYTGLTANPDEPEIVEVMETLTVVDSVGSVYSKDITVHVVDTTPKYLKAERWTRFINEYYYYQPEEKGGLADDSVWKTDPEYVKVITEAFENLKNDTPIMEFHYTHEDILEMKEYIQEHGIGNSKEPDALRNFYDRFMEPNRTK